MVKNKNSPNGYEKSPTKKRKGSDERTPDERTIANKCLACTIKGYKTHTCFIDNHSLICLVDINDKFVKTLSNNDNIESLEFTKIILSNEYIKWLGF